MKNKIYNCHIHTFTEHDVPRGFLPLELVRILSTKVGFNLVAKTLNFLNPLSTDDQFKKYVQFATIGALPSQERVFLECIKNYPSDSKFVVLAVDMEFMNAGKIPRTYVEQLDELKRLTLKYPDNIIPFVHIDPRREMLSGKNGVKWLKKNPWVKGIKLYPPLGIFPNDERLHPIYEYCEEKGLPIITHCGPSSPTHNKSSKKKIREMLGDYPYDKKENKMELCAHFAHPSNYIPVLEKYPNLKLSLAHWGSEISWEGYMNNPSDKNNWLYIINDMLLKYPNLYTDVSFSLNNQEYFSVLKVLLEDEQLRKKVLFGSDFYMVQTASAEKRFSFDLRAYLGEELWSQISFKNPINFLDDIF